MRHCWSTRSMEENSPAPLRALCWTIGAWRSHRIGSRLVSRSEQGSHRIVFLARLSHIQLCKETRTRHLAGPRYLDKQRTGRIKEGQRNAIFIALSIICVFSPTPCSSLGIRRFLCAVEGSLLGQLAINGDSWALTSYGYTYSLLWRNYAVLLSFMIVFYAGFLVAN